MTEASPADAAERARALDPRTSFIVQAPAGSGKTELLIRRVLVLLAHVDAPEEVVALTFTRKAAAEMRARVLAALAGARDEAAPQTAHERETWQLARSALARDAERGWDLLLQPARLRIQTLDGLCASLVRRLPLQSRLGVAPAVPDDCEPLYRAAARATLTMLEEAAPDQAQALGTVLAHLDNRGDRLEALLIAMLRRRDQWLRSVVPHDPEHDRERLQAGLRAVRRTAFARARAAAAPVGARLVRLAAWAAAHLEPGSDSALAACRDLSELPGDGEDAAAPWLGLVELLLTRSDGGAFRKVVNKNQGFPPQSAARSAEDKRRFSAAQQEFAALAEDCAACPGLLEALGALRRLPPPVYDDAQWQVLGAAAQVLRLAAAQLELEFAARNQCDFIAVAQAARAALGSEQAPTDLLLALDARIRHLLVDEFQDTSVSQFELLTRLAAGWSAGDGRTLFLVGDPMQSIYRFREAEVGLFLRARSQGVGALALTPLRLSTNFRSERGIVDWINAAFARVFPAQEDIARGAVAFEPATHWHPQAAPAVSVHAWAGADDAAEAARVAAIARQARAERPQATIAVLVRARSHLAQIVPALRAEGLPLRAVEIETLRQRPIVLDLLALARALSHPADRIAWLALLRAPWCGLTLADLHALAQGDRRRPLWALMTDEAVAAGLSDDGRTRLAAAVEALRPALADLRRGTLRDAVEGAWLRLGGADCLRAPRDLADAQAFLELLAGVEEAGDLPDLEALEAALQRLFAAPDPVDAQAVELMTIHKAKGLEFDVVIVPGLHRRGRNDEPPLLALAEVARAGPSESGGADLVFGAIAAAGDDRDPVHGWICDFERERQRLESARLLYVAATRARSRLHLLGAARRRDGSDGAALVPPAKDTLLAPLWPVVAAEFEAALACAQPDAPPAPIADAPLPDQRTWRLAQPVRLRSDDARLAGIDWRAPAPAVSAPLPPEFSWAGESLRLVGTVVHRWLQRIARDGAEDWPAARIAACAGALERDLALAGVPPSQLAGALGRARTALESTLADARGRWLLRRRPESAQAASELRLTGIDAGVRVDIAVDRSFIEDDVRWVVDYKTGLHEGAGREQFLDNEVARYREQLARYARLVGALGPQPVRCALYFPLLGGWREWSP
jgi:ATP-dependent exoDNAse (exonuclease V) beta subunit